MWPDKTARVISFEDEAPFKVCACEPTSTLQNANAAMSPLLIETVSIRLLSTHGSRAPLRARAASPARAHVPRLHFLPQAEDLPAIIAKIRTLSKGWAGKKRTKQGSLSTAEL